jgi:hypothetical protein
MSTASIDSRHTYPLISMTTDSLSEPDSAVSRMQRSPCSSQAIWLGVIGGHSCKELRYLIGSGFQGCMSIPGFTFSVMFLPYPSSAFVPVDTMPAWIHGFARNQPVTTVIETIRGLLLGLPLGGMPWRAVAWCAGIIAVSVAAATVLFRRRTR